MVRVLWIDSGMHVDHGWGPVREYMQNATVAKMKVLTVGILMAETEEAVAVALSYDDALDQWNGAQLIARQNVLDMRDLGTLV